MKFNVNEYVRVKLTPKGIQILKNAQEARQKQFPAVRTFETFRMPEVDSEGYTKYQLWDLMDTFGNFVGPGLELPFETEIDIPVK